jgi:hypothetical protein
MRRSIVKSAVAILGVILLAGFPGFAVLAHAEGWCAVHGNSGVIQTPSTSANVNVYGWGLSFSPPTSPGTWVHFSVPAPNGSTLASKIRIMFYLATSSVVVSEVDVWNGRTQVKRLMVNYYNPGLQTHTLALGSAYNFSNGMGLSVHVTSSSQSSTNSAYFSSVAAYYTN